MNLPEATLIEQLPVEVLRHIAAFCPPHCLLSLCSASHALRSACYDSLTFKQLIANAYLSEQSPPFHLLCQHLGLETQAWARYAVALSRESSCDFSCAATWDAAPAPGRFENYLPQLFVSGCKHLLCQLRKNSGVLHHPCYSCWEHGCLSECVLILFLGLNPAMLDRFHTEHFIDLPCTNIDCCQVTPPTLSVQASDLHERRDLSNANFQSGVQA